MKKLLLFIATLVAIPVFAQGHNCDCQQYTGSCEASISVVPTQSTQGSYGADLNIRSTAPQCSKVDYYVDGTPYFTILSQGNQGEDRVFGQKPITRANVSGIACRVCRIQSPPGYGNSSSEVGGASNIAVELSSKDKMQKFLQGTWCMDTGGAHTVVKISGSSVNFASSYEGGAPSYNSAVLALLDHDEFEFRRGNGTDKFSVVYAQGFKWIGRDGGIPPYPGNLAYRCGG